MLGEGMTPPTIGVERITSFSVNRKIRREEVSDRTAWIFAQVALYLGEGFATFSPVHPKQNLSDPLDAMQLIDWIRTHLSEAERDLGWSNQPQNEA